jgi:hypothetical protein
MQRKNEYQNVTGNKNFLWIHSHPKTGTICALQFQVATSLDSFPTLWEAK